MRICPANVAGPFIRGLEAVYPGYLGNIISPGHWRGRPRPWWVLDNGCFSQQKTWTADRFWRHCDKGKHEELHWGSAPQWVAVPDAVGDPDETLRRWAWWAPRLRARYGWPLAFIWQDGAMEGLVRNYTDAEVWFVGGRETDWKMRTAAELVTRFPRVHVGRINAVEAALDCWHWGVESIDGSGWCRTDRQRRGLKIVLRTMWANDRFRKEG